ncbi:hypothetical protein XBKQ1_1830004 [Xenorhabdus bovienii str. kraussei Quebec]|uniref:Uncharacterized protein n=1 Tax=Xenorhabdus bovienii str. kraussei Quebec TaxID=1398203 RepID=A0A077P3J8_XENBV|nr:hypothetical protein XBKQ1_1830004 [Xenorhabdus bovienii str. kraussei Quebec]
MSLSPPGKSSAYRAITAVVLGFNNFRRAQTLLAGIEWVSMLRKGQYLQKPECSMSPAAFFYQLIV